MTRSTCRRLTALTTAALIAGLLVAGPTAPAHADTTAATDDASVSVPTGAWVYAGVTVNRIGQLLQQNGARITDLKPHSITNGTWAVTMVRNAGVYAVPGWWWYTGVEGHHIAGLVSANSARLIELAGYDDGTGTIRYALVMISNSGASGRGWTYQYGVTTTQIGQNIQANNQRLISLDSYLVGDEVRYAAVFVTNSGSDAKSWQWWVGQSAADVGSRVNAFGGRIVDVDRMPDGWYVFVMVANSGADNKYWRFHVGLTLTQVGRILGQYGVRAVDLDVTPGKNPTYTLVAIDNSTAENRRLSNIVAPVLTRPSGNPAATWGHFVRQVGTTTATAELQADTRFEPASAIKSVHNLAIISRVVAGTESLAANNFAYFNYTTPQPVPGNACPVPAEEVPANQVVTTVDNTRRMMMFNSDNRTTRGVVLRYGLSVVQSAAATAGMTSTTINQDLIGCGFQGGNRNQTTLRDLGRLYANVDDGSLLGVTGASQFFSGMNGGSFNNDSTLETNIADIVRTEAAAAGKSANLNNMLVNMNWSFKPGGYAIGCGAPFTTCTQGGHWIGTTAGVIRLPFWTGDSLARRSYVFGTYIDGLNLGCGGCPTAYPTAEETTLRAELLRPAIRAMVRTW